MATTRPNVALNNLRDMPFNKLMLPVSAEHGPAILLELLARHSLARAAGVSKPAA